MLSGCLLLLQVFDRAVGGIQTVKGMLSRGLLSVLPISTGACRTRLRLGRC
jgi:hypothetical protein